MRNELLTIDEAKGKTIDDFLFSFTSGQMIITLTDNSFICFGVDLGYDPGDTDIVQEKLELFDFRHDCLVNGGILSREELDAMKKERDDAWQSQREANERRQFEILQKKFENT